MEVKQTSYVPGTIDLRDIEFATRRIPKHPFVEYEPSDLDWLIPLGGAPVIEIPKEVVEECARKVDRYILNRLTDRLHGFNGPGGGLFDV